MNAYDIIIVGAGIAGLRAALECNRSLSVAVISFQHPYLSHSAMAGGGINAALDIDDSPAKHAYDTIKGGDYLADQDIVLTLCKEAPGLINELETWGAGFDKNPEGKIARRTFGGASIPPRAHFISDQIGRRLVETILNRVIEKNNVQLLYPYFVVDVLRDRNSCCGVLCLNLKNGEAFPLISKAVIMATGGCGQIYRTTSNSEDVAGDGIAIAFRNGCILEDMEFIQFHPTQLFGSKLLISEGTRAEGAILINATGERFMIKHAKSKELAPRDIVSRAMFEEISEGRCAPQGYVYLDMRPMGAEKIRNRFPSMRQKILHDTGIDLLEQPIPVIPCQHYIMGGIEVDGGLTNLNGLFAAGECSCMSVHGGNRLGGNSLLEGLYSGKQSARASSEWSKNQTFPVLEHTNFNEILGRVERIRSQSGNLSIYSMLMNLKNVMTCNVGLKRNFDSLAFAEKQIWEMKKNIQNLNVKDDAKNGIAALKFINAIEVAETIVISALNRKESRGSHYRSDFPERDDKNYLKHTLVKSMQEKRFIYYKPVRITRWHPAERTY